MARDRNSDRIRGASSRYCPHRGWTPDGLCNFRVRASCTEAERLEIGPYTTLKGGSPDVQGKRLRRLRAVHLCDHFLCQSREFLVVPPPHSKGKLLPQGLFQLLVGIS